MAGTSAKKFIYKIEAEYSGESAIQRLQKDLQTLDNIQLFSKSRASLAQLRKDIESQRKEVERLERAWKQSGSGAGTPDKEAYDQAKRVLDGYLNSRKKLVADLTASRRALQADGEAAKVVAARYNELSAATRQAGQMAAARKILGVANHGDIANQINQVKEAYRRLKAEGNLTMKENAQAALHMTTRIQALREQTNGWSTQLLNLRNSWAGIATAFGGIRLFKGAVTEFGAFESAMLRVKAVSEASASEMNALKAKAQELGASTRYTAREVAQGMTQLAAAGQKAAQIESSIGAAMDIAAIAQMDVGMAADQLTNIMSQFSIEAEKSRHVADVLASGFTGAATTMDQLANAMLYAGPVANALGYSLEDTTAILMALANAGYKGEKAGTALRGGFTRLLKPMKAGQEVLDKYGIKVYDAQNKMRDFADILEDIGKASMTEAELIKLFGQEAGPGMIALLGQGADAIRKYQERLSKSGGLARRTAEEMESGIEGAFRRLQAAWDAFKIAFGDAALAKYVKGFAEVLAKATSAIANMPDWGHKLLGLAAGAAMFAAARASMTLFLGALKLLAVSQFTAMIANITGLWKGLRAFTAAAAAAASQATFLSAAFKGFIAYEAAKGVLNIAELVKTIYQWRKAEQDVQASQERGKKLQAELAQKYEAISKATGVVIKSHQDLVKAIDEGKLHYDDATGKWVAGAKKRVDASKEVAQSVVKLEGEALEELIQEYKKHFDEIVRLQDDILGRQKSLAAELRDMGREGMSDKDAWADQKREAEEYVAAAKRAAEEARRAMEAGDTMTGARLWKDAVQYADDAKQAYKSLNKEVKDGDTVIVSKAEALETAMSGVKEAGELAIDLLKQQQEEAYKAMDALEEQSGFAGLVSHMDEAMQKWMDNWQAMQGVGEETVENVTFRITEQERQIEGLQSAWMRSWQNNRNYFVKVSDELKKKLDDACKPRTVKVYVAEVQKKRWGGLVGNIARFARGGKLAGYGGGDRIPALLESGEFVIRKEAVRKFGTHVFAALNNLRLPELPDLTALFPQPAAALPGGGHMVLELKLPGGETVAATVSGDDAERLARFNRRVSNTRFRR